MIFISSVRPSLSIMAYNATHESRYCRWKQHKGLCGRSAFESRSAPRVQWSWPTVPPATVWSTGCLQWWRAPREAEPSLPVQPEPLSLSFSTCFTDEQMLGQKHNLHPQLARSAPCSRMLWGAGVILQADSDPGRDGVGPLWSSPLWKCPAGVYVCVGKRGGGVARGHFILCFTLSHWALRWPCRPRSPQWGERGKGKWRVMIPAVHVLDADANTAWRGSIGNIFSRPSPLWSALSFSFCVFSLTWWSWAAMADLFPDTELFRPAP